MKPIRWLLLIFLIVLLAACAQTTVNGTPKPGFSFFATNTPLPTPRVYITAAPDARVTMTNFLAALKNNDFASMYALLSKETQASITLDDFTKTYNDALNTMSAGSLDYEVHTQTLNPDTAQVGFGITYRTALVGDIQREISAALVNENGEWRIKWDPGLILPELAGGNVLKMDYQIPSRGNIYDRNGLPIAAQSDAVALGIDPGGINPKSEGALLTQLQQLTGVNPDDLIEKIANTPAGQYIAVGDASADDANRLLNAGWGGLLMTKYNSRYYFSQGIAPQVVGYTQLIPKEEINQYLRQGYRGDEKVGVSGIEKSMEQYLGGKHGGTLYAIDPNGQPVARIGSSDPQAADSVYLTIDRNLQYYAQQALTGYKGAIVVIERDTGRVLAMASSPEYDPNLFDTNNFNRDYMLNDLLNNPDQPLVNRAAQGELPLGSVFKVITFSAALESGLYLADTTYNCQYTFTELTGVVLYDWTWQKCQDKQAADPNYDCQSSSATRPSGLLTLPEGLMRSCNPFFWRIGLDLFNNNRAGDIGSMARAFGLGAPTGIGVIAEASGNIGLPATGLEATNQAIGQGDVRVTPLQVARFIAAVGNGGTLYRPQLIEKIQPVDGNPVTFFKPEASGTLPLRPDNLALLQQALVSVVKDSRGTAYYRMIGLQVPVAGKTGTAESGSAKSHAWFAGYTMANEQDTTLPNIAVAVVLENQGEGSDYAAPIFRWMVETYYYGKPQSLPWFGPIGNPYTPTPLGGIPTKTPKPKKP